MADLARGVLIAAIVLEAGVVIFLRGVRAPALREPHNNPIHVIGGVLMLVAWYALVVGGAHRTTLEGTSGSPVRARGQSCRHPWYSVAMKPGSQVMTATLQLSKPDQFRRLQTRSFLNFSPL